jgi:hypothetical protein
MSTFAIDDGTDPIEFCYEQGWTDGLPVVPPTPEKVAAAVAATGREADELVCAYPERHRELTVGHVAANAVMAGCRPEYVPVVVAIVEAMATDAFGLHAANATTGGSAVGFIVNGPVRTALGMNCRGNVLGPGNRANSTIGRAVRLVQINGFGSVPGAGNEGQVQPGGRPILDRATLGQPGKYAGYHIVENEEDYPTTSWRMKRTTRRSGLCTSNVGSRPTRAWSPPSPRPGTCSCRSTPSPRPRTSWPRSATTWSAADVSAARATARS